MTWYPTTRVHAIDGDLNDMFERVSAAIVPVSRLSVLWRWAIIVFRLPVVMTILGEHDGESRQKQEARHLVGSR